MKNKLLNHISKIILRREDHNSLLELSKALAIISSLDLPIRVKQPAPASTPEPEQPSALMKDIEAKHAALSPQDPLMEAIADNEPKLSKVAQRAADISSRLSDTMYITSQHSVTQIAGRITPKGGKPVTHKQVTYAVEQHLADHTTLKGSDIPKAIIGSSAVISPKEYYIVPNRLLV